MRAQNQNVCGWLCFVALTALANVSYGEINSYQSQFFVNSVYESEEEIIDAKSKVKDTRTLAAEGKVLLQRAVELQAKGVASLEDVERLTYIANIRLIDVEIAKLELIEAHETSDINVFHFKASTEGHQDPPSLRGAYSKRLSTRLKLAEQRLLRAQEEAAYFEKQFVRQKNLHAQDAVAKEIFQMTKAKRALAKHAVDAAEEKVRILEAMIR